jgi:adenine-specific DNA-methyltransferase
MPTKEQLRSRLLKKLKELFQLNQPDLDFGFYRIMHAKSRQVQEFIEKDLLKIVEEAFGQVDESQKLELKAKVDEAIEQAKKYGAPDPENTPAVEEARALYATARDTGASEADVYDHLYRFFERYYDDGDFISRRYYTRETSGKAAPFAIPYNGEEVKLHWANADQYYIKTTEYFSNFTFDLWQNQEIRALREKQQPGLPLEGADSLPRIVHFKIVEAAEGEHGNIKETEEGKRYFIIHSEKPVEVTENGELVINFEYRPDPEKSGQEGNWRDRRNTEAVTMALFKLEDMAKIDQRVADYLALLKIPAPTESDKKRPLLAKYVNQYTARNTMDYFIHKDLGSFLHRELDFYIKNEVMRLDDIENAEAPAVESYLVKLKVLRNIAGKLIDFLSQLENFQKKLWLKKKFVVETNYCITLDRVPEELYSEIAASKAQHDEWVKLFAIDEIVPTTGDMLTSGTPGYSQPLTVEFLKANDKLVLDTRFFDESFKAKLLASIDNFDEQCGGLIVHSENFQALNLLQERYREQVKCIYIDPPYNTSASEIIYKNSYKHSSWLSLLSDRLAINLALLNSRSIVCITIDDVEFKGLCQLVEEQYGPSNILAVVPIRINPSGRPTEKGFALTHEYAIFAAKTKEATIHKMPRTDAQTKRFSEKDVTSIFEWRNLRREGSNSDRIDGQRQYYPIYADLISGSIRVPEMEWNEQEREWIILGLSKENETVIWPINDIGQEKNWRWSEENLRKDYTQFLARVPKYGTPQVYYKYRPNLEGFTPLTLWTETKYSATEHGTKLLKDIFGDIIFSYPKSIFAVSDCLSVMGLKDSQDTVLDYFAGSGTTGHAVIRLNREDSGQRKYILVEMGDYFDTVMKPRIVKVVYSADWKDGKPTARDTGISHCFKYLRLESYEDTLNNLEFKENSARTEAIKTNPSLQEDFMLHYLLDVETRGSQSLLNIDHFSDPTAYMLKVKKPGSDEYVEKYIDLIETFNYLIGLRVNHSAAPQTLNADFKRLPDPELPGDQHTRLKVDGNIRQNDTGHWWFRKIEGWVPKDTNAPNGTLEKVMIVWRKLTGDLEKDNLMLDEWFQKNRINFLDFEFGTIYVNGSNNLQNLAQPGDNWKVRLIEEEFMKRMWDMENT